MWLFTRHPLRWTFNIDELVAQKLGVAVAKVRIINGHHHPSKLLSIDLE